MEPTWLNTLANSNPQLVRELRGRLKLRSVLATIAISLVIQLLILMGVLASMDFPPPRMDKILWQQQQWRGLWEQMAWILYYVLFASGAYFLVNDIAQEERSGTMNFIRSSPRPPYEILIGKILGVPILPYLAIVLAIPLHWFAGLSGRVPSLLILSYDILMIAGCILFFCPALLLGLLSNAQRQIAGGQSLVAFAYTGFLIFSLIPIYTGWNFFNTWKAFSQLKGGGVPPGIQWGYLPIGDNILLAHGFVFINIAIVTFFIWRMLLRRFYNRSVSTMSKRLSYALVAYIQILLIGFTLQVGKNKPLTTETIINSFTPIVYSVNLILFVCLIFALCPQRQAILDWLRYRQHGSSLTSLTVSSASFVRDLIWADGSPGVFAIAINLLIANALVWPWLLLIGVKDFDLTKSILFLSSTFLAILIQATIAQMIFAARLRNPTTWAIGTLITWLTIPPILMTILKLTPEKISATAVLWTIWGFPGQVFNDLERAGIKEGTLIGLIFQVILLGALLWQLLRQFEQLAKPIVRAEGMPQRTFENS